MANVKGRKKPGCSRQQILPVRFRTKKKKQFRKRIKLNNKIKELLREKKRIKGS